MSIERTDKTPLPPTTLIRCRRLVDGTGRVVEEPTLLTVQDGRIVRIERDQQESSGAGTTQLPAHTTFIDAGSGTVIPGLMDVHVHLASVNDPKERNVYMGMLTADPCLQTLHAAKNARLVLEAGFTTVRDVAGFANARNREVVALRRAVEIGLVPGPRIVAAGWVTPTAGHLDMGTPVTWAQERSTVADGPWECRKVVRSLVREGVDCIKTSASGGSGGFGEEIWWRNYTVEELSAIAEEAHSFGRRVACHCHTAESVKNALKAGIDTIEHGTELDDECIELFLQTDAILVPTLMVKSDKALQGRLKGQANDDIIRKTHEGRKRAGQAFKKALAAGVRIAVGTDIYLALRNHWGENAHELEMMVDLGMSSGDAIVAGTKVSAEALGMQDELGTLEAGKIADLNIIDGNPLEDIRILQDKSRIALVMKAGEIAVDRRSASQKAVGTREMASRISG